MRFQSASSLQNIPVDDKRGANQLIRHLVDQSDHVAQPSGIESGDCRSSSQPATAEVRCQKIMVVDDNHDAAEMLSEVLRLLGNDVVVANDGQAAIASAARIQPQVVFMDIGLPGMDGYAVARALRAQPETATAVLVAVTGYGQCEDVHMAHEAGFDHHLVKPADLDRIGRILASLSNR